MSISLYICIESQGIKHYLLDFVLPDTRYSVADYKKDAKRAIKEILEKGKTPIIVGGTGLYVDSLIYEIEYQDIKFDEEYRKKLEKQVEEQGLEVLYNKAKEIDPEAIAKISKKVFDEMYETGKDAKKIVEDNGMTQMSDEGAIKEIVEKIVAANPKSVEDYKAGKDRAIGFLVGQVMKETHGKANPGIVNKFLLEILNK